jgi:glycosyltransferase involved in cell wall biosynthesis
MSADASNRPVRVFQYGVHDASYPRNARVRRYLDSLDGVEVSTALRARSGGRLRRALDDLRALWRGAQRADVVLLSEFRLTHAPLVKAVAAFVGARTVVDGFVGLHETAVGDWGRLAPRSFRARRLALHDRLAVRSADLYLIDTEVRAEAIRRTHPGAAVLALPVGAPSWAAHRPHPGEVDPTRPVHFLYYGNYIPLHGLDLVVDAFSALDPAVDFRVTFLGDGGMRPRIEARVAEAGWASRATFLDSVREVELAAHIASADVVLGVFGDSEKARTVLANKVWQGLASGRVVVTQAGAALDDLPAEARALTVASKPGDAGSLARALVESTQLRPGNAERVRDRLEQSVSERYAPLGRWLVEQPSASPSRSASSDEVRA